MQPSPGLFAWTSHKSPATFAHPPPQGWEMCVTPCEGIQSQGRCGQLAGEFLMGFYKGTPELRTRREESPTPNTHIPLPAFCRGLPPVGTSLYRYINVCDKANPARSFSFLSHRELFRTPKSMAFPLPSLVCCMQTDILL